MDKAVDVLLTTQGEKMGNADIGHIRLVGGGGAFSHRVALVSLRCDGAYVHTGKI